MKRNVKKLLLPLIIALGHVSFSYAENIDNLESMAIANKVGALNGSTRMMCGKVTRCSLTQTTQFYTNHKYLPVWTAVGRIKPEADSLLTLLRHSYQDGLNPFDYHTKELKEMEQQINEGLQSTNSVDPGLLADFEVTMSDAYLLYVRHMELGRVDPLVSYPDWQVSRRSLNILDFYNQAIAQNNLVTSLGKLTPTYSGYADLKAQLAKYQQIASDGGWQTIPAGKDLKAGSVDSRVEILQKRLAATEDYKLDDTDEQAAKYDDDTTKAVKQFQRNNGLKASGIVDKTTLQSLNVSVEIRIKQIQLNMDRLRWLPNNMGNKYLMVNIPSYSLVIVNAQQIDLAMPVIVGGGGNNKTCVVNSKITTLELNPFWGIPNRIATKEYLSKIQKDPSYLEQHNIRVFNPQNNQEIDPTGIDWQRVTQTNFSYFLRQDPGKKNALGKLKFLFPNDCGIYLHDTSNPNLFGKKARSLSHGCVRVSQPLNLADYLISSTPNWDDDKLESAINTGKHRWLKLAEPLEIHIVYQTAWVESNGQLQFRNDIYKADNVDYPIYIPKLAK
ncbi:MAG: L,D-transpeptidase family protein [Burkholderiales bacterium]|nr:L,D-transpeptidase family protein [Burkholderiales bacterium]